MKIALRTDIAGVAPGTYTLLAVSNPGALAPLTQQSVVVGDRDLEDVVLSLQPLGEILGHVTIKAPPEPAGAAAQRSDDGAGITGSLQDEEGKLVSGATVVAVPEPEKPNRSWLYRQSSTDQYGQFTIDGLAPGTCRVYAFTDLDPGANSDPEFLSHYTSRSVKVVLNETDSQSISLTGIAPKDN